MKIFIVIPAYNEGPKINEVLDDVLVHYSDVVVVNDGSDDNTLETLQQRSDIHVLNHIINRGQGAALRTGTNYAIANGADIVVHFDADGQHQVEYINNAVQVINQQDIQVVLGTRFGDIKNNIPKFRSYSLKLARLYMWLFGRIKLTDPQNGFRVFNREAAQKIIITQDRMAHTSEILMQIRQHRLKYKEIPIYVAYTEYSRGRAQADDSITRAINITKELLWAKLFK